MSLYVLDTDTLSLYEKRHPAVVEQVTARSKSDLVAITIISVEEQFTGRYALLRKADTPAKLAAAYLLLTETMQALAKLRILTLTEAAAERYVKLTALKLNVGKMDLRIAAIALENGATVVTRNTRDFGRVPGLVIEDWAQ
jgi:tRNA(fMet)-specific endonuclease VapC